ncbi:MAG TPA: translation initiation factor IF-2 [Leptospiraceae bacterium]|nr:translation initiation factor IF-2 [Leptospiraceae bacterium]HMW05364.1 translation initiation factor IF-2 [Leptospiraceae bacterium]HMX34351.1 translation initiation factor IF-2 [Leptospiraceae bacterium]HMY31559.1 translation initiation factor IF-2 [Leptospiraceae bacterium]HMZ64466.1 translation initiation factor IF-2 [Leptospiraceae bacterium]
MEEKKDNKSIKDKLLQGQDSSHKKIVIKRKSPIAETPATNVNPPKPKKDLDLLVKEETERQQAAPKPFMKTVDDSKIIVNRNVSETFQQKEKEKEKDVSETQTQQQSKETNVHQETRKQNINQQQSNTSQQSSRPHPAYPVRSADRNPIVSRPQKPVGGQQSNRDNSSQGSGNRPNRPQGNYQGQGGGNRNFHQKHPRPNQGGGNQGQGNYQRRPSNQGQGGGSFNPIEIPKETTTPGITVNRKRNNQGTFDKNKDKNAERAQENSKFFKQMYKKTSGVPVSGTTVPKEISIMENVQVGELAKKLNLKPNDVIAKLMKMGMMVTINNVIDSDTAILLADEYGCAVKIVSLYEETVIQEEKDSPDDYINRPPVVTIMGHVDHGKTKLLDTIRKSAVIDTESGGITQHIGAYQVHTPRGVITFLDTPGHEAFTSMRARGASITDIVVLVVAADDGVKPQTIEAVNHAKAAEVPIIVAINKIDLPSANVERVLQDITNLELLPEEWGGKTIVCKISARENIGIDKLLEMILIQAEMLDLKANPNRVAKGTIIEAKLDPGRGAVATVLIQNGTLRIGDAFLAGVHSGRVRAMYNDHGHHVQMAEPSFPVLVTGLDAVPDAGDPFDVIRDEKEARNISQHRKEYQRIGQAATVTKVTLDNMNEIISQGELKELKIIIKTDVRGSAEAIKESLEKLSTGDVKLNVIHAGTGAIVDTDVMLASASNALIVGFHVRANPRTLALAEKEGVQIKYYSIIYDVVNEIKAAMEGLLEPEQVEKSNGKLEVRNIFKISKVGNIAGCMVTSGKIHKNNLIRIWRDNVVIFEGKLKSLKRMKDDVTEVLTGFECGLLVDGFNDFIEGDEIESYEINSVARKL